MQEILELFMMIEKNLKLFTRAVGSRKRLVKEVALLIRHLRCR